MFNEREALRLRLEQLNDKEIIVMRDLREEREGIYSKLRELDKNQNNPPQVRESSSLMDLVITAAQELKQSKSSSPHIQTNNISQPFNKSITSIQREAALKILSMHKEGIRGAGLRKEIEKETGMKVKNMTTFMSGLMKHHPEIKKPGRGHYVIKHEKSFE
ncbi:hypothetical protein MOF11_03825 [Bacillus haynesii]|uniref:Rok-like winged helix domain-containing protein n=1 Tax=Bacillus haynesii TaxID=1925021 RepID=UPI0022813F36|nr:hypothetical protein [Bacillus haynesii]MCY9224188.1 hypothetical protein [Bacillus haynesii]